MSGEAWNEAWDKGDKRTNYRLKDGDRVELLFYQSHSKPGEWGTVVHARTCKVTQKKGTSPYFANVDMDGGTRIRVPHGALKKLRGVKS